MLTIFSNFVHLIWFCRELGWTSTEENEIRGSGGWCQHLYKPHRERRWRGTVYLRLAESLLCLLLLYSCIYCYIVRVLTWTRRACGDNWRRCWLIYFCYTDMFTVIVLSYCHIYCYCVIMSRRWPGLAEPAVTAGGEVDIFTVVVLLLYRYLQCYCTVIFTVIFTVIVLLLHCFQDVDLDKESLWWQLEEMIICWLLLYCCCTVIFTVIVLLLCCFQDVDLDKESLRRQVEEMMICWLLLYCCCTVIFTVIILLLNCFQDVDLDKESLQRQLEEMLICWLLLYCYIYCYCTVVVLFSGCWPRQGEPAATAGGDVDMLTVIVLLYLLLLYCCWIVFRMLT